jgi:hypothetical protein
MPKPRTFPGSTRVSQSKESNGTYGRPAIFHPAKKIPTSAAVTIEATNRPPDTSRGNPLNFMQQLAPRSSIKPEPRIVQVLRRTKTACESSGKDPFHAYVCLPRRTNCTHSAMAGDDGFLYETALAAACEASVKDQCQLNDSAAAYRHGLNTRCCSRTRLILICQRVLPRYLGSLARNYGIMKSAD